MNILEDMILIKVKALYTNFILLFRHFFRTRCMNSPCTLSVSSIRDQINILDASDEITSSGFTEVLFRETCCSKIHRRLRSKRNSKTIERAQFSLTINYNISENVFFYSPQITPLEMLFYMNYF